jgi:hypothetical protein
MLNDHFWRVEDEYYVYTTNRSKKIKEKYNPMATYYWKGKVIAYQYHVEIGSIEQRKLFKELGLTPKHEVKEKRRKRADE